MKKIIALGLSVLFLFLISGCSNPDINISTYEKETVTFIGLEKEPVVLTIKDLKEMKLKTKAMESTSDKIGEIKGTGPLLDTVLKSYGVKQKDYKKIKFYGKDNYEITLNQKFLKENQLMLAFGINGKALDEESAPLRLMVPNSDSAYWIRKIQRIELIK